MKTKTNLCSLCCIIFCYFMFGCMFYLMYYGVKALNCLYFAQKKNESLKLKLQDENFHKR